MSRPPLSRKLCGQWGWGSPSWGDGKDTVPNPRPQEPVASPGFSLCLSRAHCNARALGPSSLHDAAGQGSGAGTLTWGRSVVRVLPISGPSPGGSTPAERVSDPDGVRLACSHWHPCLILRVSNDLRVEGGQGCSWSPVSQLPSPCVEWCPGPAGPRVAGCWKGLCLAHGGHAEGSE